MICRNLPYSRFLPFMLAIMLLIVQFTAVSPTLAGDPEDVLALVNEERIKAGAQPLTLCPTLNTAAQNHSDDMAARGYFDHFSPEGTAPWDRITAAGYTGWTTVGENIALGQETPQEVFTSWWNSPGHHDNMMNPAFKNMGLGTARGDYEGMTDAKFWTQTFGANGRCEIPDPVDLSVTITDDPDPIIAMQDLTYTINVHNGSAIQADGSRLSAQLPSGVIYVSATPDQGSCTRSGQTVTCNLGSIGVGSSVGVTLVARPSAAATITTRVSITTTDTDTNTANNSASAQTTVLPAPPAAPTLLAPLGAYAGSQPVFKWTAPAGAVRYEFQYGTNNPPDSTPMRVSSASITLPAPLLLGTYYWRVLAFNSADMPSDTWSEIGEVTIESSTTESPFRGYFTSEPFSLTWSRVTWATGYEVQVYASPTVATENDIYQSVDKGEMSFEVTTLPDGIYFWRVCARNTAGTCLWSPAERFGVNVP